MVTCFELFFTCRYKISLLRLECENHLGHEIQTDHVTD